MALQDFYNKHSSFDTLEQLLAKDVPAKVQLKGLCGSAPALLAAGIISRINKNTLFILPEKEEAAYFAGDLITLLGEQRVLFFPSSYKRAVLTGAADHNSMMLRAEALTKISESFNKKEIYAIVTYPEGIAEKVIDRKGFDETTLPLHAGEKISIGFIRDVLQEYHFEKVDFVYEPGQYAIRGSIVDVFSYSCENPYRIDFFGDEVESIRSFNIESQLSVEKLDKISIVPDLNAVFSGQGISFIDYLPSDIIIWTKDLEVIIERIEKIYQSAAGSVADPSSKLIPAEILRNGSDKHSVVEFGNAVVYNTSDVFVFNTRPQPAFNKQFNLLADDLHNHSVLGFENYILSDNPHQIDRLNEIFRDLNKHAPFIPDSLTLHQGFIDHDMKKVVYTDHQIFDRFQKFKIKQGFKRSESITISELNSLKPGDFIVHIDHGIGKFGGLEKTNINGKQQEVIKLVYRDNDILYISIHSLHKISRFRSKDGETPKIYKLGTGAWQKIKDYAKKKVKDIARDLIALYAKRISSPGFSFSGDTYLQQELEASFIYEDTPDQEKATHSVKKAMESEHPMDMLVCGDVGFGKTEVAIRSAFKAVSDSKQVAVLVPTTILALQHYNTFVERLKGFPCTVDYISRFRSASQQKEIIKKMQEGKVDIIIGTHRLLGKDIKFKDLGLLIIDEEQKFGVASKEKIKSFRVNVDTLTLTATPIPRTLQFSLMGARDMTIINTPPPNRQPIHSELHSFDEIIIREAIDYELSRGGQVFFIHNRVQNIIEIETLVKKLCPHAVTAVAHGQLESDRLEKIMLGFIAGDCDVLIATNIIESGLDIPNANTIIINNAHHFGLSDLHQLRGRVGRSNKKAFCYLIAPPLSSLPADSRRRLQAIEDFSELGSGFNIAMLDLDIRGAGNLLGSEQSGFIADMGYETYHRILNEAILELKESEFKDVFFQTDTAKTEALNVDTAFLTDCQIDTDLEILFPEEYISNVTERTKLYKELDNIGGEDELAKFERSLIDRFGPVPPQSSELLQVVRLRRKAMQMGIEKIVLKNSRMVAYFISNRMSPFYRSELFTRTMGNIQKNYKIFNMKENKDKLVLSADNINNIEKTIGLFELLEK